MNSLTHDESIENIVQRHKKRKTIFMMIATLCMVGFIVFSMVNLKVFASDPIKNYSFAKRATTFMSYFNLGVAPDDDGTQGGVGLLNKSSSTGTWSHKKNGKGTPTNYVYPGNAGAFVAYDTDDAEDGLSGYIVSKLSFSSYSVSYDRYFSIPTMNTDGSNVAYYHGIYYYARYGYTLSAMGFDTVSGDSNFSLGRAIAGYPILFVYLLALAVPMIFHIVVKVLQSLNPFAFFLNYVLIDEIGTAGTTHTSDATEFGVSSGGLTTIKQSLRELYSTLNNLSWTVLIPLFLAFTVAAFLLFKKNQNGQYVGSKIKKYIIRIVFLVAGLPILGSLYTSVLVKMSTLTDPGNSAATKMVLCTFVNFESWAANTRLCPPTQGVQIVSTGASKTNPVGQPDENTMGSLRSICAEVNVAGGGIHGLFKTSQISGMSTATKGNVNSWNSTSGMGSDDGVAISTSDTIDLINAFTHNSFYTSGAYESKAKAEIEDYANDPNMNGGQASYYAIFESTNNPDDDLHTKKDGTGTQDKNGGDFDVYSQDILWNLKAFAHDNEFAANPFANGGMTIKEAKSDGTDMHDKVAASDFTPKTTVTFTNADTSSKVSHNNKNDIGDYFSDLSATYSGLPASVQSDPNFIASVASNWSYSDVAIDKHVGLSTLGLYNYLNTSFDGKEMICYSPSAASSHVRKQHHSVNLIGTGFLCFLYWLNLFILCGGIATMGIGYALALLFSNIKRGWQIIFNVPLATLGALQAIAKLITYTIVLIVEVIGTMFMYQIMESFMLGVAQVVETPFKVEVSSAMINLPTSSMLVDDGLVNTALNGGVTCSNGFTVTISVSLMLMLSSAVLVWITINSFRFRKAFVKSVDEMAAKVINKFITGNDAGLPSANVGGGGSRGGGGLAPALAAGAAQGAMANRLNSGNKAADKNKTASANTDGKGSGDGGGAGGTFKDSPDASNQKDAQAGEDASNGEKYDTSAETSGDSAAMNTEGSENANGHSDLEDKKAAEAMGGSPTSVSNNNADIAADNDSVANVAAGDKAVNDTDVNNATGGASEAEIAQGNNIDNGVVAEGDAAVQNATDNANQAIDAANNMDTGGGADHSVVAGDVNNTNIAGSDVNEHTAIASGDNVTGDNVSNATNNSKNASSSASQHNVKSDAHSNTKNSSNKSSNKSANVNSNIKSVGTGASGPTSKKGQKLQAKYDKRNLKRDANAAKKNAVASQNAAVKAQTKTAIANNAKNRAADVSKAKTNESQKKIAKQNADNRLRTAQANYNAALASGDKNRIQAAKVQMADAKEASRRAGQDYRIAHADTKSAERKASGAAVAAQNAGLAVKGIATRADNRFDISDNASKAANVGGRALRATGNVAAKTAKTAGKVAVGTAAVATVATVAATKKAVDFHDEIVDDTF